MRIALIILALLLYVILSAPIDLGVAAYFYKEGAFHGSIFSTFLYRWGVLPADSVAAVSAIALLASFGWAQLKPYRGTFLYLVLVLAVGAGLVVHGLLKDHWGRPRPKQTEQFGGEYPFRAFYEPDFKTKEPLKSFACGHCTTAFYFFSFAFIFKRHRKVIMVVTLIFGAMMGYARMEVGGHYLSDVLAAAVVMWMAAYLLQPLIYKRSSSGSGS